jgi:MoaA/NifB/PqqE/SkfB family radical SAM enzyme
MLAIEIIEGCNFKCYFCAAKDLKTYSFISLDLFKRVVLEAKDLGITKLNLTPCKGEPFMHPNIYEILNFVNQHMKETLVFTNATAINVNKLKKIKLNNVKLCVSYYGETVDKFIELTQTTESLFNTFHRRLIELKDAAINHEVHRRDLNYKFDYDGNTVNDVPLNKKCKYHHEPKVFANGDVTFCIFAREEIPNNKKIFYDNVNNNSLKNILENPLRYKFYDSQSLCISNCSSYDQSCYVGHSLTSIRLLNVSKKQYVLNKETIDKQYEEIEHETLQRIK